MKALDIYGYLVSAFEADAAYGLGRGERLLDDIAEAGDFPFISDILYELEVMRESYLVEHCGDGYWRANVRALQ